MRIQKERCIGLVIDYQERLVPHMHEQQQLLENSRILIEGLKALGIPLLVTEQYRKAFGGTVTAISDLFSPFNPLEKISFSCCDDQVFEQTLSETGRKNVLICGIESHICVLQTAIDLIEKRYLPVVVSDCISSRKLSDQETAVERMKGEGVMMASYESILFELCRYAKTAEFRAISKLVK